MGKTTDGSDIAVPRAFASAGSVEGDETFRQMVEGLRDPVYVYCCGKALYANAACAAYLGYENPAELVSLTTLDVLHPDDVPVALERERRMQETGQAEPPFVFRFKRRDGRYQSAECRPSLIRFGGEQAVVVVCHDLRERIALEDRFHLLLDVLPDPFIVHRDGTPLYVNPAAVEFLGYESRREVLALRMTDMLSPEDVARARSRIATMLASGKAAPITEFQLRHRAGHRLTVEVASVPTDFMGDRAIALVMRDLSKRTEAEAEIRRAARSFRALMEQLPIAISVYRRGEVLYVNPAMANLLGYDVSELVGTEGLPNLEEQERKAAAERMKQVLATGKPAPPREVRAFKKNGEVLVVESTIMRTEWHGERALLVIAQDLTARRAMHARLLQTDRMASIGTLAAGFAHEINNPLSYVTSNLRIAVETLGPLPRRVRRLERQSVSGDPLDGEESIGVQIGEVLETLDEAKEGADRIRNVVQDVRTFSRTDEDTIGPVDAHQILESSINMARNEIRHRARLVKDYDDLPAIDASQAKLGQLFLNLLVNAAQALPVGEAEENEIRVSTKTGPNGDAVIEISDTGPGIPADIRDRVFEPFFTTKPAGVGTGLGLAICRNIVTACGGEITVEGRQPRGSTFRIRLPAATKWTETPSSLMSAVPREATRAKILIVDDEPAVARAIRRDLARQHDVVIVNGGRQAVDVLLNQRNFDIVFCDLMMPDLTGMDVFELVCKELPDLKSRFVFMTGGAFTAQAREFLASVDNVCLDKPFRPDEVRELARASISGRGG